MKNRLVILFGYLGGIRTHDDIKVICSVTRLGVFKKCLATYFVIKIAQIFGNDLGYFVVCQL